MCNEAGPVRNRYSTGATDGVITVPGSPIAGLRHTRHRETKPARLEKTCWVVRLTVLLGLLSAGVSAEKIANVPMYPRGDSGLAQKYVEYNRLWFDDKLPAAGVDIGWGDLTGTYYTNYEGEGFQAHINIIRKVEGYDNRVCMEVLHEMVHLKLALNDKDLFTGQGKADHGAQFQQEMLSLANRGAFASCW